MTSKIDAYENVIVPLQKPLRQNSEQSDYEEMGEVYFAFIDVLGFKYLYDNLLAPKQNGSKREDPGNKFKKVFSYYFQLMNAVRFINEDKDTYAGQTSDSLYFYTKNIEFLLGFINIFTLFNQYAMTQNVFFRGGIAQGCLFRKEKHQFYGDSVIKAYLLENVIAQNPVIYVDCRTANAIYSFLEKNEICTKETSIVFEDSKNQRYYLKPFYVVKGEDLKVYFSDNVVFKNFSLTDIQKIIKKNKEIFEYHPKTFNKYTFLENEINR